MMDYPPRRDYRDRDSPGYDMGRRERDMRLDPSGFAGGYGRRFDPYERPMPGQRSRSLERGYRGRGGFRGGRGGGRGREPRASVEDLDQAMENYWKKEVGWQVAVCVY
eukprot:767323-Hanusia_phi.AAC.1